MIRNKERNKFINFWLPVIATFVSVSSIIISIRSCSIADRNLRLSEKSYYLNLDHGLRVEFERDIKSKIYKLKLENVGVLDLQDIVIYKEKKVYLKNQYAAAIGISSMAKPWFSRKEFESGKKEIIDIDSSDFKTLFLLLPEEQNKKENESCIRIILFKISFKTESNLKEYRLIKALLVEPLIYNNKSTYFGIDPEMSSIKEHREYWEKIYKIESELPWIPQYPSL
jgi:hypothetical protein